MLLVRKVRAQTRRRSPPRTQRGYCMGQIRSELLAQAISRLTKLTPEEQDVAAIEILAVVCPEEEWVLIVASEPYQKWLASQGKPQPQNHAGKPFRTGALKPSERRRRPRLQSRAKFLYCAVNPSQQIEACVPRVREAAYTARNAYRPGQVLYGAAQPVRSRDRGAS